MKGNMFNEKKGIFHSLDAILAAMIITTLLIFSTTFLAEEKSRGEVSYVSQDIITVLSNLKITEINNPTVIELINKSNSSTLSDEDRSVLEQIGMFWAEGRTELAQNLTEILLDGLLNDNIGISISFDNEEVFIKNKTKDSGKGQEVLFVRSAKSMISGITEGKPSRGISSRVFLQSIRRKTTNAYVFFGGFEGQGNITKQLSLVDDANVIAMRIEIDAGSEFDLYINNNQCLSRFYPGFDNMSADSWNISACNGFVIPGTSVINKFSLTFPSSNLSSAYIAGGFIKVTYTTESLHENLETNSTTQFFPGIDGLVNLYSSFYAPGDINNMNIHFHYWANHSAVNSTFYFNIGNTTVYTDKNTTEEQSITLDNATLASVLDYTALSQKTVPFRIGFENFTHISGGETGNADVILITDLSESMEKCLDGSEGGCTGTDGDNPSRVELAKEVDKEFISLVLEGAGNRVGLVTYSRNAYNRHDISDDNSSLQSAVDNFPAPNGGTCVGCAIRQARLMLEQQSNDSRQKYIIVMTDGIGNFRTDPDDQDDTACCTFLLCRFFDSCGTDFHFDETCDDYIDEVAKERAITDACYARQETNATIHSVAFSASASSCDYAVDFLEQIALCGEGKNYSGTNVSGLRDIYETIATELVTASKVSQLIEVEGEPIKSIIYPDSHIEINYSRDFNPFEYGQIALSFDISGFDSCSPNFEIPEQVTVANAWATSYSGKHWTDVLTANSNNVFMLSDYGSDYSQLGDPFRVQIPENLVGAGSNSLLFNTGDSSANSTGCSLNNSFIYTGMISSSTAYTGIYEIAEGCIWQIEFEDGTFDSLNAPAEYDGSDTCSYTSTNTSYDSQDAAHVAMFNLLQILDLDGDNRSDINIGGNDLVVVSAPIGQIPFLWGPAITEVKTWQ